MAKKKTTSTALEQGELELNQNPKNKRKSKPKPNTTKPTTDKKPKPKPKQIPQISYESWKESWNKNQTKNTIKPPKTKPKTYAPLPSKGSKMTPPPPIKSSSKSLKPSSTTLSTVSTKTKSPSLSGTKGLLREFDPKKIIGLGMKFAPFLNQIQNAKDFLFADEFMGNIQVAGEGEDEALQNTPDYSMIPVTNDKNDLMMMLSQINNPSSPEYRKILSRLNELRNPTPADVTTQNMGAYYNNLANQTPAPMPTALTGQAPAPTPNTSSVNPMPTALSQETAPTALTGQAPAPAPTPASNVEVQNVVNKIAQLPPAEKAQKLLNEIRYLKEIWSPQNKKWVEGMMNTYLSMLDPQVSAMIKNMSNSEMDSYLAYNFLSPNNPQGSLDMYSNILK